MVKNKVLTPVLAGVLGLSIVGSGLGYYFEIKTVMMVKLRAERLSLLRWQII